MNNIYVGDIGDFSKFGLLRALLADTPLRLGVNWYYTGGAIKSEPASSQHYKYLNTGRGSQYEKCDPELHATLGELYRTKCRSVATLEERQLLPSGTVYFRDEVGRGKIERRAWAQRAQNALSASDVIFLDPDNGMWVMRDDQKHVLRGELSDYLASGEMSVIVYQHKGFVHTPDNKDALFTKELIDRTSMIRMLGAHEVLVARWYDSSRAYFILPAQRHKTYLSQDCINTKLATWRAQGLFKDICVY